MSENDNNPPPQIGKIEWFDLTVQNATEVRDFYANVIGWEPSPVSMGDYDDFNMNMPGSGTTAAGVCHARGGNSNLPAQWLIYVRVADMDQSITACKSSGGRVIDGPRPVGESRFCVIQDPAGAVLALISD